MKKIDNNNPISIKIFRILIVKRLPKADRMARKESGSSFNRDDESVWSDLQVSCKSIL